MTYIDDGYGTTCNWANKLFNIHIDSLIDKYLKIALPAGSTVRTILLSAREFEGVNDGL
jgi:hypothetical protein